MPQRPPCMEVDSTLHKHMPAHPHFPQPHAQQHPKRAPLPHHCCATDWCFSNLCWPHKRSTPTRIAYVDRSSRFLQLALRPGTRTCIHHFHAPVSARGRGRRRGGVRHTSQTMCRDARSSCSYPSAPHRRPGPCCLPRHKLPHAHAPAEDLPTGPLIEPSLGLHGLHLRAIRYTQRQLPASAIVASQTQHLAFSSISIALTPIRSVSRHAS